MTPLLDVNVLVALAWPKHVHHHRAVAWFSAHATAAWANVAVTQAGFVRVPSNRRGFQTTDLRAKRRRCCVP